MSSREGASDAELDNQRLAEEQFKALNAHDVERYVKTHADSYIWESDAFPTPVRGTEGVRQAIAMYFKAFPDLHFEVEQIITSGDYVVGRWRATGTHKGEFNGIGQQQGIRGAFTLLFVGSMPLNSPLCVPVARQRPTT